MKSTTSQKIGKLYQELSNRTESEELTSILEALFGILEENNERLENHTNQAVFHLWRSFEIQKELSSFDQSRNQQIELKTNAA